MLSEVEMRPVVGRNGNGVDDGFGGEDLEKELGLLLREQRRQEASDRERELNIFRSGSAPPSVEGSLSAFGGLFNGNTGGIAGLSEYGGNGNWVLSEEELRSDPAYLEYYYSHVNLNPRLPPPALSKEDWRFAQRLQVGNPVLGGIGDNRKGGKVGDGGSSLQFSQYIGSNFQQANDMENRKVIGSGEWLDKEGDGLIGLSGLSIGSRPKSTSNVFQDDSGHSVSFSGHPSRPASRNAMDDSLDTLIHHDISSSEGPRVSGNSQKVVSVQPIGPSTTQTFASVLGGSLSRSATPDPQCVARAPSPCLPPVGVRMGSSDKKGNNGSSSYNNFSASNTEPADLSASFSSMNLSRTSLADDDYHSQLKLHKEIEDAQNFLFDMQGGLNHVKHPTGKKSDPGNMGKNIGLSLSNSQFLPEGHSGLQRPNVLSSSSFLKVPSGSSTGSPGGSPARYQNADSPTFTNHGLSGYVGSPLLPSMLANQIGSGNLPPLFENAAAAAAAASMVSPNFDSRTLGNFSTSAAELQNLSRIANQAAAAGLQMPPVDPLYLQYLRTAEYASQFSPTLNDSSIDRNYGGNSYSDLLGLQNAYLETLLSSQNQYNVPYLSKSGSFNHAYYGNPSIGLGMTYPGSPLASPIHTASPVSPLRHGDRGMRFPSGMRNLSGGLMGSWRPDVVANIDEGFASSLLEEFKSNKTKCFELSEIAGHVVEFSADQYGSRFIQQKLETATIEEKNMVFDEIFPQCLSLMTDVFGNYVIQKFFEHGIAAQRRELANQLTGHVLTLSLQMYGCRVIQKAIEVVDLDLQTKMVAELDGHVMRCVRDQNGNHVIQKCIECIPQDAIQFIISSFYDQVVTLSTHPYGCRVIQRVLEHCNDQKTQKIVMDEIMQCICMLAQDQYGNYVVQHVLEHGKPQERSAIIKQLAGQIVQMSQQKFASNVVEKCLTFGGPAERQILVNEMLGTTDENEPLQAMMKDQFANYVVQKVLETCDDQQRELILSRIKVHLNALKKYTYGKHIVARVEKLVAAGERRIGVQSSYPSA